MIITIDGSAGTGKTTVARFVAQALNFNFVDTGSMYRAITWWVLHQEVSPASMEQVKEALLTFSFTTQGEGKLRRYFVGAQDVTEAIRLQEVTAAVSEISAYDFVRKTLWKLQREMAQGDVVFEGRDMGSYVFPDAEVKIFLTARPEIRAERRLHEILKQNPRLSIDASQVLQEILQRDKYDSNRSLAPLKCPPDAYQIDTSELSIQDVVDKILKYKEEKCSHAPRI